MKIYLLRVVFIHVQVKIAFVSFLYLKYKKFIVQPHELTSLFFPCFCSRKLVTIIVSSIVSSFISSITTSDYLVDYHLCYLVDYHLDCFLDYAGTMLKHILLALHPEVSPNLFFSKTLLPRFLLVHFLAFCVFITP